MTSFHPHNTLRGRESCSHFTDEDTKAQRGSFACSGLEHVHPAVHNHHRPEKMRYPLPSSGPAPWSSHPPAITLRAPGWAVTQAAWYCAVVLQVAAFTCSSLARGPSLWSSSAASLGPPALGPGCRAFPAQWASTSLWPSPTSASCTCPHLSLVGF